MAADEGRGNTRTARGPGLLFELCLVCRKFDRLLCEVRCVSSATRVVRLLAGQLVGLW